METIHFIQQVVNLQVAGNYGGWYSDHAIFPASSFAWFRRGGYYGGYYGSYYGKKEEKTKE